MFKVINNYTGEVVKEFDTREAAEKWIISQAEYGIYRTWCLHGVKYYDVGNVYYILS